MDAMKFNVQRVLTPAYLTSVALVVVGVLLALEWFTVAAWVFVLLGLGLNAVAVAVTEIHDGPRTGRAAVRRRPSLRGPSAETPAEARSEARAEAREQARAERAERRGTVEPDTETVSNPVVPSSGSSSADTTRGA
jgi:hypothetical protein